MTYCLVLGIEIPTAPKGSLSDGESQHRSGKVWRAVEVQVVTGRRAEQEGQVLLSWVAEAQFVFYSIQKSSFFTYSLALQRLDMGSFS